MNPSVRNVLLISAKQAVGAIIGNAALAALLPGVFNLHDPAHALAFLKSTLAIVAGAEAKVWVPRILLWVNSPTNGENGDSK